MPAKKRTSKRRPDDELTFHQYFDLLAGGPLGGADDGRRGRLWDSEEDRRAAYDAHRARVLRTFLEIGTPPPRGLDDYEPDSELKGRAVAYWSGRCGEDLTGLTPAQARERARRGRYA